MWLLVRGTICCSESGTVGCSLVAREGNYVVAREGNRWLVNPKKRLAYSQVELGDASSARCDGTSVLVSEALASTVPALAAA